MVVLYILGVYLFIGVIMWCLSRLSGLWFDLALLGILLVAGVLLGIFLSIVGQV